jgi:glycosyltransferase involved in cell wall biosynthesis
MEGQETVSKKILFVITKGNWGGAQKYVFDMASSLPKNAFDPTVAYGTDTVNGDILQKKLSGAGIRTVAIPRLGRDINIFNDALVFFDLIRLFQAERPDIVHLNSSKIGGLGALAARLAGIKKIIFTVHGLPANEDRPWLQKKFIALFSWLTILFCHTVIVLGEKEKNQIERWPFCRGKIVKISSGVRPIDFLPRDDARKYLEGLCLKAGNGKVPSPEAIWTGTISELHKNKGLDVVISALALTTASVASTNDRTPTSAESSPAPDLLATSVFFIIGEGEERSNLEKMIHDLNLVDRVFLLGRLEGAARYLKAFDVFTLTSRKEGLPYAILEAGLAGLPVVASKVGDISEIIEDHISGLLITPKDPAEIRAALKFLASGSLMLREFGANLQARVRQNFSFQKTLAETIEVYSK